MGVLGVLEELIRVIEEVLGVLGGRVRGGGGRVLVVRKVRKLPSPSACGLEYQDTIVPLRCIARKEEEGRGMEREGEKWE